MEGVGSCFALFRVAGAINAILKLRIVSADFCRPKFSFAIFWVAHHSSRVRLDLTWPQRRKASSTRDRFMSWYYAEEGKQVGPITDADFESLVVRGTVRDDTLVW